MRVGTRRCTSTVGNMVSMTTTLARPATAATTPRVAAYGVGRPTVVDARASIERIYRTEADRVWNELTASVIGTRGVALTVEEIVAAMSASTDDVVRLCGKSLSIRLRSYTHLAATHDIIG